MKLSNISQENKYTMLYKLQIINIINFTAKACNMLL